MTTHGYWATRSLWADSNDENKIKLLGTKIDWTLLTSNEKRKLRKIQGEINNG